MRGGLETREWVWHWRLGRLRISSRLMRHRYAAWADRWVWQPGIVYDRAVRKAKP